MSDGVPFPFEEYEKLAGLMKSMKGKAMLSINDHPDIRKAFEGLPMLNLEIKYAVASSHGAPRISQELVITNWELGTGSGGLF